MVEESIKGMCVVISFAATVNLASNGNCRSCSYIDRKWLIKIGIVSTNVTTTIPPTNKKTTPMATPRLIFHLNSKNLTSGLSMNAVSVDRISVKTRSGKNEATQKRTMMRPTNAMTFANGLLDVEIEPCID